MNMFWHGDDGLVCARVEHGNNISVSFLNNHLWRDQNLVHVDGEHTATGFTAALSNSHGVLVIACWNY